jgi:hypothetical protein
MNMNSLFLMTHLIPPFQLMPLPFRSGRAPYIHPNFLLHFTAMKSQFLVCLLLASNVALAAPESKSKTELQQEIASLKKALSSCQSATTSKTSNQRAEAVASLRAIQSALNTGANFQEFKRYQIESRIKVEALPRTPENEVIYEISDTYRDAVTFFIIERTGTISDRELEVLRARYDNDEHLRNWLAKMRPNNQSSGYAYEINKIQAEASAQASDLCRSSLQRS